MTTSDRIEAALRAAKDYADKHRDHEGVTTVEGRLLLQLVGIIDKLQHRETTVRIYGASDDLLEVDGAFHSDEFYTDSDGVAALTITGGEGEAATVIARYLNDTWLVGLAPADEDSIIPERWNAHYVTPAAGEPKYSAVLALNLSPTDTITKTERSWV